MVSNHPTLEKLYHSMFNNQPLSTTSIISMIPMLISSISKDFVAIQTWLEENTQGQLKKPIFLYV